MKPIYNLSSNSIQVILPVIEPGRALAEDEQAVYKLLSGRSVSRSEIAAKTGFSKTKVLTILSRLESEGYIRVTGNGKGTKYISA